MTPQDLGSAPPAERVTPLVTPTLRELVDARLSMAPARPNGVAWHGAYVVDTAQLLAALERADKRIGELVAALRDESARLSSAIVIPAGEGDIWWRDQLRRASERLANLANEVRP